MILEHLRTFQEHSCHNQIDDGKTWLPKLERLQSLFKTFMWQLLDGKYDSIIV